MSYVDGQCGRVCFPIMKVLFYKKLDALLVFIYYRTVPRDMSSSTTFGLTGLLSMREEDECSSNEAASEWV